MAYKHITIEEREKIQELRWREYSIRAIAKQLHRSPSSISRELQRNGKPRSKTYAHRYMPRLAHTRAIQKRRERGRKKRLKSKEIRTYVIMKLKAYWSPEQIAGRIQIDMPGTRISHEAIYQYIYHQVHRNGWGYLKPNHEDLRIYLRRHRKRRTKKGLRKSQRIQRFSGTSIEERAKIVTERRRIGDWESDSVESCTHKPGVNTLLERRSGLYFITKLHDKGSTATTHAITQRLSGLPVHTVTLDNGSENAGWRDIETALDTKTYFCHPYCSGEKGSNENTNGLLRQFFPKKTDFTKVSNSTLHQVEYILNTRPRKRLGYRTPLEVFNEGVALTG